MKQNSKTVAIKLACTLGWNWICLSIYRAIGNSLLGRGEPLNSNKMLLLNKLASRHVVSIMRNEPAYERLLREKTKEVRVRTE